MAISSLELENFTAFRRLNLELAPRLNVFIGTNGTGKTHLLKVAYAACAITTEQRPFAEKLERIFLPSHRRIGRMVRRQAGRSHARVTVRRPGSQISVTFSNLSQAARGAAETGTSGWLACKIPAAFIPVKEMLANAPGFRSLYALREIHFEEVYADILDRAYLNVPRKPSDPARRKLLATLQEQMDGRVVVDDETFFLHNKQGNLEFTLLSEGYRKLGLLWLLIQNGALVPGSALFWDEPEANMNPTSTGPLMEVLLELSRLEVQVFLATHDYSVLKELELRARPEDAARYHGLYRDGASGDILCESHPRPFDIVHSAISGAMSSLYDRELERAALSARQHP